MIQPQTFYSECLRIVSTADPTDTQHPSLQLSLGYIYVQFFSKILQLYFDIFKDKDTQYFIKPGAENWDIIEQVTGQRTMIC